MMIDVLEFNNRQLGIHGYRTETDVYQLLFMHLSLYNLLTRIGNQSETHSRLRVRMHALLRRACVSVQCSRASWSRAHGPTTLPPPPLHRLCLQWLAWCPV